MSVITLIQRALPFSFSWKRRSTCKGKAKVVKVSDHDSNEGNSQSSKTDGRHPSTALPSDALDTSHIAVKPDPDQKILDDEPNQDFEADEDSHSQSEDLIHRLSGDDRPARPQQFRTVSWANIAHHKHRWASEQEEELNHARKQLTRCQKAWSSEQELWLDYIEALSEVKEAHEWFMLQRTRQQDEERQRFRKAWRRRRSGEELALQRKEDDARTGNARLRLLQRYVARLSVTESRVAVCRR